MEITGQKGLGNILKRFLQLCFIMGSFTAIILPFLLNKYFGLNFINCFVVIYPNAIILAILTYEFIKLFDSLRKNNPFCKENVKILKTSALISLIGSFCWLYDLILGISFMKLDYIVFIATLIFLTILFLGVSIALYILAQLIKKATEYKEENELTI